MGSEWKPIDTAPKDGTRILVYGKPTDVIRQDGGIKFLKEGIHAAYYDLIDQAFCLDGGDWLGPFIEPKFWHDLPPPPGELT